MPKQPFFDEQQEQSLVKATIVQKYFWAWAKVIMPTAKKLGYHQIAYIDLFAGPGRYKDGSKSTPIMILEQAIRDENMKEMLFALFNDMDESNVQSLETSINELEGIEQLRYKPQVMNNEIGDEIVKRFESVRLAPTLFFIDPWGYKGLSLPLINSVLKDWGCDCIIFFNFNRINMGISNDAVDKHMQALFGGTRAHELREKLEDKTPYEREMIIVEEICQALKEMGGRYTLPFVFKRPSGSRTSHHLIFVSKHHRGYEIMKDIMAKESSTEDQGVPSFEYNPASREQPLLFSLQQPLDQLETMILSRFSGRTLTRDEIFSEHHVDTPYVKRNYTEVLAKLEDEQKISISYSGKTKRAKHSFGSKTSVTIP